MFGNLEKKEKIFKSKELGSEEIPILRRIRYS
jgi:hypothetical protein